MFEKIKEHLKNHYWLKHTLEGTFVGYFILHPLAMVMNVILHIHIDKSLHVHGLENLLPSVLNSFKLHMFPFALIFMILGSLLGLYNSILLERVKKINIVLEHDIIKRKSVETQLIEEKNKVTSIIEAIDFGLTIMNPDYDIIFQNKVLKDAFGGLGEKCHKVYEGNEERCDGCPVKLSFKDGKSHTVIREVIMPSGETAWWENTSNPIKDADQKIVSCLEIAKNITEHKKAEDDIENYVKEIEESNNLKDLFSDIMTHDLINPLTSIIGFADLVREEESIKNIKQNTQKIRQNAYNLYYMLEAASHLTKIGTKEDLDTESRDLSSIVKEAKDIFESYAEEKNIEVVNNIKGEYPAQVNPSILDVFTNLVSNAIKYSPPNSKVNLDISDDNDSWIVRIKDNGKGIPDKYKETIFSRFERLEKKGVKGSGLGLAITKKIVDLHNGCVWVEDNSDEGGSIFYVSLPKKEVGK